MIAEHLTLTLALALTLALTFTAPQVADTAAWPVSYTHLTLPTNDLV